MDKTYLVKRVKHLLEISGHSVQVSVNVNHREIDIVAEELDTITRKIILAECTEEKPVGIAKLQDDVNKLKTAQSVYRGRAVLMHVSIAGYSPDAQGWANSEGVQLCTLDDLESRLINFDPMLQRIREDRLRPVIMQEYQPNEIHYERNPKQTQGSLEFLRSWMATGHPWLTLLGDYGVGKSWTLRRYLYMLAEEYEKDPVHRPLPFFVPLQQFVKAFDLRNLIQAMFVQYGLRGVHYEAFEYLMNDGKIVFLLDSFDEMAQTLHRVTIRENLLELLRGIRGNSRAIMTSRPTYFESRAERLVVVETNVGYEWHPLDEADTQRQTSLSRALQSALESAQFARLRDLSLRQRQQLFASVLKYKPEALKVLGELHRRFTRLEDVSKRAVIARLLTTVAETLAQNAEATTPDGYPLLPKDLEFLNQAKIFEIIINNLLSREQGFGYVAAGERLQFLRNFAVLLQGSGQPLFALPHQVRGLVEQLFEERLRRTDTPEQLLENIYRTCRRHAGLTTESQFLDTTGQLDIPVDEEDPDARVGFSHNSLREYLVADAIADWLQNDREYFYLRNVAITDAIAEYFAGIAEYRPQVLSLLSHKYRDTTDLILRQRLFELIHGLMTLDPQKHLPLLGIPPMIDSVDISSLDLSSLPLKGARIVNCIAVETDFRKSDLASANFSDSVLTGCLMDGSKLRGADFRRTDVESIFAYDPYGAHTQTVLKGRDVRQWLYCEGALVDPTSDLNLHLGQPWYEAAREVTATLLKRFAGSCQDVSLVKGTSEKHREIAVDFVAHLIRVGALEKIKKAKGAGRFIVKANPAWRARLDRFNSTGEIPSELSEFFDKYLKR